MTTIVIGAGVVGLATAYELLKAGHDVVVIERDEYGQGPSFGNAAVVTGVLSFPVPAPGTICVAAKSLLKGGGAISIHPLPTPRFAEFLLRMANATRTSNFELGTSAQDLLTINVFHDFDELIADDLLQMISDPAEYIKRLAYYYSELNMLHPFREGNGRTLRTFISILAMNSGGNIVAWDQMDPQENIDACAYAAYHNESKLVQILARIIDFA